MRKKEAFVRKPKTPVWFTENQDSSHTCIGSISNGESVIRISDSTADDSVENVHSQWDHRVRIMKGDDARLNFKEPVWIAAKWDQNCWMENDVRDQRNQITIDVFQIGFISAFGSPNISGAPRRLNRVSAGKSTQLVRVQIGVLCHLTKDWRVI